MKVNISTASRLRIVFGGAAGLVLLVAISACSKDQPKPMAQPTPDQVRGRSDKSFDALKQEDQERASQQPVQRE